MLHDPSDPRGPALVMSPLDHFKDTVITNCTNAPHQHQYHHHQQQNMQGHGGGDHAGAAGVSTTPTPGTLCVGPSGDLLSVPSNYTVRTIIYAGTRGIRATVFEWGELLRTAHQVTQRLDPSIGLS